MWDADRDPVLVLPGRWSLDLLDTFEAWNILTRCLHRPSLEELRLWSPTLFDTTEGRSSEDVQRDLIFVPVHQTGPQGGGRPQTWVKVLNLQLLSRVRESRWPLMTDGS